MSLHQLINGEWIQSGQADLVAALRRHPVLLRDRSLLLTLALEEYRAQGQIPAGVDLKQYCHRFAEFGSSIERSILRQLEAQRYLDAHPEILELLCSPHWPKAGEDIGAFHVLEEFGFGATAHVYLCRQKDVGGRKVVVKLTPFSNFEASILGRLSHPNIIPIYSTGYLDESGLHFVCMPYCGRSTLADLLDVAFQNGLPRRNELIVRAARRWMGEERLPTEKVQRPIAAALRLRSYIDGVLALAIQLADALDHAHHQHILHGDLKPSNVLLTPSGKPLLLDFNLSQDESAPGICGGTLPYMPPEHLELVMQKAARRESSEFDPTSDVYSFGALLYELLTGNTPVELPPQPSGVAAVAELLLGRLRRGAPSVRQHNRLVSRRLESVVLRCLAFDRGRRPGTMAEVKQSLQTELRSLSAIKRFAFVHPFIFSAVVALPMATMLGTAANFATRPPRYISEYEKALQLISAGELHEAVQFLSASVASNPSFISARFQLGRTKMQVGQLDSAMDNFARLARNGNDADSMAYMGYCYNVKRLPIAAIPWYEQAINCGATSAAVYNNLGASYLEAPVRQTNAERMRLAEEYLLRAHELDRASVVIRLNIVRHAQSKAKLDSSYDPICVWRHAQAILRAARQDSAIRSHVARWYHTVESRGTATGDNSSGHWPEDSSERGASSLEAFMALCRKLQPTLQDKPHPDTSMPRSLALGSQHSSEYGYYLEPVPPKRTQF